MKKGVLDYLVKNDGAKARDIAAALGCDKTDVNSILYTLKTAGQADISPDFRWSLVRSPVPSASPVSAKPAVAPPVAASASIELPRPALAINDGSATREQQPIIGAPSSARLVVEAGPGTGKTETLANRVRYLVGEGGLAASNVLVLSFSVAAVKELTARIERLGKGRGAAAFVDIRTFDSFASRFLRQVLGAGVLQGLDYDERILRATEEIEADSTATRVLREYRHVLLDEVQDLVGVRADFALSFLKRIEPGFSIFGDSAQGIYDFQIDGGPSPTTSSDLLTAIRRNFPDLQPVLRLTKNFRVGGETRLQNIAEHGRKLLLESPEKARAFLEKEFSGLADQGNTGGPKIDRELLNSSTCVVCRTNGQVLQLAGELNVGRIPFRIAHDRNKNTIPVWPGLVFFGWDDPKIRRQPFVAKAMERLGIAEDQAVLLWNEMLAAAGNRKAISLEMTDLRGVLVDGAVLPEMPPSAPVNAVQLTTIHRSKGREFANVIVVKPDGEEGPGKGEDAAYASAEPRVLFVALTRAKKSLRRMVAKPNGERLARERWIRSFKRPNGFRTLSAIEVGLAGDIDALSFARGPIAAVAATQAHLLRHAVPGAAVELRRDAMEGGCPRYLIVLAGERIGRMSSEFGWAVWHTIKGLNGYKPNRFPAKIQNLWVRNLTTAVGDLSSPDIDRSLLTSGLWLVPVLEGLGKCEWQ